jgi:hypothetical protein
MPLLLWQVPILSGGFLCGVGIREGGRATQMQPTPDFLSRQPLLHKPKCPNYNDRTIPLLRQDRVRITCMLFCNAVRGRNTKHRKVPNHIAALLFDAPCDEPISTHWM